jgi:hypothetical protein
VAPARGRSASPLAAMKTLFVLLIAAIASVVAADAPAPNHAVRLSKYSPALRLVSYDKKTDTFTFLGTIKLVGTLFVEFDMDAPDRANGEINFQKFVPDPISAEQLPVVIGGYYPGPVRYVALEAPVEQIEALFGKAEFARLSHGTESYVSRRVSLTLHSYSATVECDSRIYLARDVSITPVTPPLTASLSTPPHGC